MHFPYNGVIAPYYFLIDDVNWPLIQRQHQYICGKWRPGRMVVETSKNNYQVWVHAARSLSLEEKRYWLKKLNSDPGADPHNRWGRSPGFRNRKIKYRNFAGGYPLSKLIWIDWKDKANIPNIPNISIQNTLFKKTSIQSQNKIRGLRKEICRSNYERGDESATDFAYALALFRRGHTSQVVQDRMLSERKNWVNHVSDKRMRHYMNKTIDKAKAIVDQS